MTLEQAKQELIRRYRYLYENSYFILAPFMYEQNEQEFEASKKEYDFKNPLIYLKLPIMNNIVSYFEEFLLSDKNIEETKLYKFIERMRENKLYLEQVTRGLDLLEKNNRDKSNLTKKSLTIWNILNKTWDYIKEQSGDLKNKENKLKVIDEYYRIARYKNNGKIYTSGRDLNLHDVSSIIIEKNSRAPFRDKKDIGITKNSFIAALVNAPHYQDNYSIFTEGEKQKIYLDYHDELPWDLEITCALEEAYAEATVETRLHRPEDTEPCGENFLINENEIFIRPDDSSYKFFQLCPHCGYIVNIPKEILSDGIKKRIEDRCSKDEKLFRKSLLYSELFSLEKKSATGQVKFLKK